MEKSCSLLVPNTVCHLCRQISIIADEYVDREFGTGALKITPAHDPNDYEIGKRHGLEVINIMNNDGTLNANAGPYADLDRADVRTRLWADMEVIFLHTLQCKQSPYIATQATHMSARLGPAPTQRQQNQPQF